MINHPNRKQVGSYAIVDAHGAFDSAGRGKSWVHGAYSSKDEAIRAARRMIHVQIIVGAEFHKGEMVYEDAIGPVFARISY